MNEYCIRHRSATYYLRAHGDSMQDGFLFSGDLLVVDSAMKPVNGDIVVAGMGAEFTVKRLITRPRLCLQLMNSAFPPIYPYPDELQIFGVVTHIIHRTREVMKCFSTSVGWIMRSDLRSFACSCASMFMPVPG